MYFISFDPVLYFCGDNFMSHLRVIKNILLFSVKHMENPSRTHNKTRAKKCLPPAWLLMWSQGDLDQNIRGEKRASTDHVQFLIQEVTLSKLIWHSVTCVIFKKTCGLPQHNIIIVEYLLPSSGQKCQAIHRQWKWQIWRHRNKWSFVQLFFYSSKINKQNGIAI